MLLPESSETTTPARASGQQREVLQTGNGNQAPFSRELCVPELVSLQAIQNSRRTALVGSGIELTYAELEAQANQIAHHLRSLGIGPEKRVGVCMSRSPLNVAAALAVLKAGGAYLPIDPNYPRERLAFILGDADVSVVVSEERVADSIPTGSWRLLMLDREYRLIADYPTDQPGNTARPEHLAYVIYTSGSTGTPKGVEITHDSLLNLVFWHQRAFGVTPEDRATQLASFGFDAAVWELWPHLAFGASVYVTPDEIRSSPELLRDWLIGRKITISFVPTALAERLFLLEWPADTDLRLLLTGADTLHHYPRPGLPFALINNYGPTEATVVATSAHIPAAQRADVRPPIGRPIDNTQIYLCDEALRLVPPGETGEVFIGGAGVARGYVNSPDMTARKFLPDPFSSRPGARLYRTGDLARVLPDGQLAYVGRTDNLIKLRGYRIEPNEIISVINRHPAVEASAVITREDASGEARLFAYVVTKCRPRPTTSELRSLLRRRLPDYMIPAGFIALPTLPLTCHGKIDRDSLPAPDQTNILLDNAYVAPRTMLEDKVSTIIANLLGLEHVGVHDNIFLIGGHSLFGTQLAAQIRGTFGIDFSLRSIFSLPTTAELAQAIERLMVERIDSMSEEEVHRALRNPGPVTSMHTPR